MNLRQAAQQALEALEGLADYRYTDRVKNTMASLRQALAEPEQEPVAWANMKDGEPVLLAISQHPEDRANWMNPVPLYTAPTPRKPLPTIEIIGMYNAQYDPDADDGLGFARAIERAHGIGGGE